MGLSQLIIADILAHESLLLEALEDLWDLRISVLHKYGHEDDGSIRVAEAVRELCNWPRENALHHRVEDFGLVRDYDGEEDFFAFSQPGALGNEPQAVEVHVGAREDGAQAGGRG